MRCDATGTVAGGAVVADERGLLRESASAYFRDLGGSAGVLIVLENLPRPDPSSLALVAYLADLRAELLLARLAHELELPPRLRLPPTVSEVLTPWAPLTVSMSGGPQGRRIHGGWRSIRGVGA